MPCIAWCAASGSIRSSSIIESLPSFLNQAEHAQPSLMRPQVKDTWDGADRRHRYNDQKLSSPVPAAVSVTSQRFIPNAILEYLPTILFGFAATVQHQWRSERSHMSLERFCNGCGRQHGSAEWYYRNRVNSTAHEWLCSLQYLRLPPQTMWSWRTFLYWNK
jgi:hypothetical protein